MMCGFQTVLVSEMYAQLYLSKLQIKKVQHARSVNKNVFDFFFEEAKLPEWWPSVITVLGFKVKF